MKDTTNAIKSILEDNSLIVELGNLNFTYPDFNRYEMTNDDAIKKYRFVRDILSEEIKSGRLDEVAQTRRVNIYNILNVINTSRVDVHNVHQHIDMLYDNVLSYNALINKIGRTDFVTEHKELNKTKKSICQ